MSNFFRDNYYDKNTDMYYDANIAASMFSNDPDYLKWSNTQKPKTTNVVNTSTNNVTANSVTPNTTTNNANTNVKPKRNTKPDMSGWSLSDVLNHAGITQNDYNYDLQWYRNKNRQIMSIPGGFGVYWFWTDTGDFIGMSKPTDAQITSHYANPTSTIPTTTVPTTTPNITVPNPTSPMPDMNAGLDNIVIPYQDQIEDWINGQVKYTPLTEEEILKRAENFANLQIDPELAALADAIERARLNYTSQQEELDAKYTSVEERTNRLMAEAAKNALASSIARGMSRSGAVEESTVKLQAPVLENMAELNASQMASMKNILNQLNLAEQQYTDNVAGLATRKGALATQFAQNLQDTDAALQRQDWQTAFDAITKLSALVSDQSNINNQNAIATLIYTMLNAKEIEDVITDINSTTGTTIDSETPYGENVPLPTTPENVTSPQISIREFADSIGLGNLIDYKVDGAGNKWVIINGKNYKVAADGSFGDGGKMVLDKTGQNLVAHMPINTLKKLLGVSNTPSSKNTPNKNNNTPTNTKPAESSKNTNTTKPKNTTKPSYDPNSTNLMPIRAYATSIGKENLIDYDAATKSVIINGKKFKINSDNTFGDGGKMVLDASGQNLVAHLPKNVLDKLLNG